MTRKLLVGPDPDGSTFEKAFGKAARLPTEEDRKAAMEKGIRDLIREDLHRDSAYQPPSVGAPRSVGTNGWLNEQPIGPPNGISLIDKIVESALPQPTPRVEIAALRKIDAKEVREKLDWAVSVGKISRAQADAALRDLGIKPDEPQPELVE